LRQIASMASDAEYIEPQKFAIRPGMETTLRPARWAADKFGRKGRAMRQVGGGHHDPCPWMAG
jgi:hypothetical protein